MDKLRTLETRLAYFTLFALALFIPLETIASWQMFGGLAGLIHPGYWGSVIGFVLLFVGAAYSLRARPRRAPPLMCVGHAWWAGMGWHAVVGRINFLADGGQLFYGSPELWAVLFGLGVTLVVFGLSIYLTLKTEVGKSAERNL
jgi:hypothetical protein